MSRRRLAFDGSTSPTSQPNPPKIRHMTTPISFDIDVDITDSINNNVEMHNVSRDSVHHVTSLKESKMSTDDESCDSGIDSPDISQLKEESSYIETPTFRKALFQEEAMEQKCARQSEELKTVVDMLESEADLVGDGSRKHTLPIMTGRHKDLKSVSPDTLADLLRGSFDGLLSGYQIVDCRYPYEYEGGHIKSAINLHTEAQITEFITCQQGRQLSSRNVLIFHCEFSSERGPKLLRHLRRLDRKLNTAQYPALIFPEVYLLDGGYKAFYETHQLHCEPQAYLPMVHESYSHQLRHFRAKSKSWTAGEKQSMRRRRIDISPLKYEL